MSTTDSLTFDLELRAVDDDAGRHLLTGLCVPYNKTTSRAAEVTRERFLPGAFASVRAGVSKVRLTDSHLPGTQRRPVGVATDLHEAPEGLMGTFRFYDTPEGRGAWENVTAGTYGGLSVGFKPVKVRQSYADGAREVIEARLYHVSLVDEPAYEEARVLAVRAADDALGQRLDRLLTRDWSDLTR